MAQLRGLILLAYIGVKSVLAGALTAGLVFALAYAQEVAIWNQTISIGPDFYVAGGMALLAFCVVFVSVFRNEGEIDYPLGGE